MTSLERAHIRRPCLAASVLVALAALAALWPNVACAAPARSVVQTFSVEARATSVGSGSAVGYTAAVKLREKTPDLRVRLRIYTSGGWLLYQKTEYVNGAGPGTVRVSVARPASEAALEPGIYRAEFTVRSAGMAEPLVKEVQFRVYDPKRSPVPVVVCMRVSGPPMTDPQGRFVVDPEQPNPALDAAVSAADLVLGDVRVKMSLALSPILLSEWQRVVSGYLLVDQSGVTAVPTSTPAPARYGAALAMATNTGNS